MAGSNFNISRGPRKAIRLNRLRYLLIMYSFITDNR